MSFIPYHQLFQWFFPELRLCRNSAHRSTVWHRTCKTVRPLKWLSIAAPVLLLPGFLFWRLALSFPLFLGPGAHPLAFVILFPVVFFLWQFCADFALVVFLFREKLRLSLRSELVRFGLQLCTACGYDLSGQRELRCPECGREIEEIELDNMTRP